LLDDSVRQLERLLAAYRGLDHLRVKRRGKSITIYSDSPHGPDDHAKLTSLGARRWGLSLPRYTGRWERTPFAGTMHEVVHTLTEMLGFHLAKRACDPSRHLGSAVLVQRSGNLSPDRLGGKLQV
jgi:hypothetical protein